MGIGEEIRRLRLERDWTYNELAKRSKINSTTLRSIETGKSNHPTTANLLKLARAFNIRPEELYQAAGYITFARPIFPWQQERPEEILDHVRLALPSTVPIYEDFPFHAGSPVEPVDHLAVIRHRARGKNLEGYIARGNCLEPYIKDGDVIIIDRDGHVDLGDVVACLLHEYGTLYLGRLRKIVDELWLENNEGRIRFAECEVAAPVIEVRRRLK